mmetsp:Transcript_107440/g.284712  ORF Transcript_107440/g.284712 Transcript_107440/m.284712 type:complete len:283 (+) Transcript_107440:586-1434(+)
MHGVRPFLHGDGQSNAEGRGGPDHALQPDERHDRDHENAHGTADGVADDRVRGLRQGCFASGEDEHGHGAEGSDLHLQVEPRREDICVQQAQHTHASEGAQETEERLHQLRLRGGITFGAGKLRDVHPQRGGFVLGATLLVRFLDLQHRQPIVLLSLLHGRPELRVAPIRGQVVHDQRDTNHDDRTQHGGGEHVHPVLLLDGHNQRKDQGRGAAGGVHAIGELLESDGEGDAQRTAQPEPIGQAGGLQRGDHGDPDECAEGVAGDGVEGLGDGHLDGAEEQH